MIRHIALGAASAAALALTGPAAYAADLPAYEPAPAVVAPAAFSWSGPYLGVQGGYSWGRGSDRRVKGGILGGYLGYNYQFDNSPVVVGLETDFNWADIDTTARGVKQKSDWNGATRARIGYSFGRFLVYGAGGLAYTDRSFRRAGDGRDSKTAYGWTVGGGVEAAVTDNVALRVEYRHNDYGKDTFHLNNGNPKSSYTDNRVMAGVAWKFNSPF